MKGSNLGGDISDEMANVEFRSAQGNYFPTKASWKRREPLHPISMTASLNDPLIASRQCIERGDVPAGTTFANAHRDMLRRSMIQRFRHEDRLHEIESTGTRAVSFYGLRTLLMSQGIPRGPQTTPDHGWLSRERALALVLVVVSAIVFYLCYRLAVPFLPALAWALALAVIVHPLHQWINRCIPGRTPAAALSVLLVAVVIIVPVSFVTEHLIREANNAVKMVQQQLESGEWRTHLEKHPRLKPMVSWIQTQFGLPTTDQAAVPEADPSDVQTSEASDSAAVPPPKEPMPGSAKAVARGIGAVITNCVWLGMQLFITLMALFFFLRDRHHGLAVIRSLMPLSEAETNEVFLRVSETIHATIYSSVVVALVQGAMGGLMFWWLGLPSPLFWGAMMALLAVVPVLGTFVIWAPTAIVLALQGEMTKALTLTAWGALAIGLIDNALNPYLIGNRMQFHTLLIFIAIIGGLALFGASGIILGPLLLAIADALLEVWRRRTAFGGTIEEGVEKNS